MARAATDLLGVDARRATISSRYADHARFDRPSVGEHQPDRAHRGRHRGLDRLDTHFTEQRGMPVPGRGEADGVVRAAHDQHFGSARPGVCHRRRPMTRVQSAQQAGGPGAHLEASTGGGAPVAQSDPLGFFGPGSREPDDSIQAKNRPHGGTRAGKEFVFDRVGLADQRSIRCVLVRLQQLAQRTFLLLIGAPPRCSRSLEFPAGRRQGAIAALGPRPRVGTERQSGGRDGFEPGRGRCLEHRGDRRVAPRQLAYFGGVLFLGRAIQALAGPTDRRNELLLDRLLLLGQAAFSPLTRGGGARNGFRNGSCGTPTPPRGILERSAPPRRSPRRAPRRLLATAP